MTTNKISGYEIGRYYWFDLPRGWTIGLIKNCSIFSRGISVAYCGSDELHEVPYVYSELVEDPEGG